MLTKIRIKPPRVHVGTRGLAIKRHYAGRTLAAAARVPLGIRTTYSMYSSVSLFSAFAWIPERRMVSTAWLTVLRNRRTSRTRGVGRRRLTRPAEQIFHQTIRLRHRHFARNHPLSASSRCSSSSRRSRGACVSLGQPLMQDPGPLLRCQPKQAELVRHGGLGAPQPVGGFLLRQAVHLNQTLDTLGLFKDVHILPLEIFHQRHQSAAAPRPPSTTRQGISATRRFLPRAGAAHPPPKPACPL